MARLNPRGLARLRDTLQSHIDRQRIPGAVAVVAQGGHVAAFEALGRLDPASGTAMKPDAIFRIYSMTKPIVSLAALLLAEEGRLQLGDAVAQYFPAFGRQQVAVEQGGTLRLEPPRRQATVHDLLRHTAGLTYEFLGESEVQKRYIAARITDPTRTNAEFCEVLAGIPLADHPGSVWHYSRATDVLGAVVEQAAGQPLGRFLQERILGPLGMHDTGFSVHEAHWPRIAEPFAADPDSGAPVRMLEPRKAPAFESGGGGLMGTAADYMAFLECLRAGGSYRGQRIVSRKTVEWMTSDHLGEIRPVGELLLPGYGFGLGFAVRLQDGLGPQPGSAGQYFWSGIGGTSFFTDPREDLVAILMTQAPGQRIFYRNLFRALVYAALE